MNHIRIHRHAQNIPSCKDPLLSILTQLLLPILLCFFADISPCMRIYGVVLDFYTTKVKKIIIPSSSYLSLYTYYYSEMKTANTTIQMFSLLFVLFTGIDRWCCSTADALVPFISGFCSISPPFRWMTQHDSSRKSESNHQCEYPTDRIIPVAIQHRPTTTRVWRIATATRRNVLQSILLGSSFYSPSLGLAANLPPSTGADVSRTGSMETLLPVVAMEQSLLKAKSILISASQMTVELCSMLLRLLTNSIPRKEIAFKRIFDAYSNPVSYKQKFLDQVSVILNTLRIFVFLELLLMVMLLIPYIGILLLYFRMHF